MAGARGSVELVWRGTRQQRGTGTALAFFFLDFLDGVSSASAWEESFSCWESSFSLAASSDCSLGLDLTGDLALGLGSSLSLALVSSAVTGGGSDGASPPLTWWLKTDCTSS